MRVRQIALALVLAVGASRVLAQVRPITPPKTTTADPSDQTGQFLPPGVESNDQAVKRVTNYKPDPVKYPVPRTPWDGKPDFSGVYWPRDRKSTRLNSSHVSESRMPSSA